MENIKLTRTLIPLAKQLLGEKWGNPTYAIDTEDSEEGKSVDEYLERHGLAVKEEIEKIIHEYDSSEHSSVSLRFVQSEVKYFDCVYFNRGLTLVQFRVRDSF